MIEIQDKGSSIHDDFPRCSYDVTPVLTPINLKD